MRPIDLREYKSKLRESTKARRRNLTPEQKQLLDSGVLANVKRMREYKRCETLYIYVSTPIEVDTRKIIDTAIADGKRVAVPRCIPETRHMTFHYINSIDELSPGTFSVLEPDSSLPIATECKNSLMLVPAMMIDRFGYRLGYGKGYYDRYIAGYNGVTAGLCYMQDLKYKLMHGRFDRKLDYVITEKYIKRCLSEQRNRRL